jgi:hypothetical protein
MHDLVEEAGRIDAGLGQCLVRAFSRRFAERLGHCLARERPFARLHTPTPASLRGTQAHEIGVEQIGFPPFPLAEPHGVIS